MVVIAAALAGAVRLWGGSVAQPPPRAEPTATPTPTEAPPSPRLATFRLVGRPGSGPPGLRVLVGNAQPATLGSGAPAVVTATGEVRPLPGPKAGAGQLVEVRRLPAATAVILQDAQFRPLSLTVLPDRGAVAHLGADLDTVVAAHEGGFIAANSGWTGHSGRLASYTAAGQLRWQRPLGDATLVQRDTPYGLLVDVIDNPETSSQGTLALIDARTGALRHRIGAADTVLASTDRTVAWVPYGCGEWPGRCSLASTDLRTLEQAIYPLPNGRPPAYGAFSTNETMLALSFSGRHEFAASLDPDGYVSVLSLVTGQFERMPGLTTPAKQAPTLAWAAGLQLMLGVRANDQLDRLLMWSPGQPGPTVLPCKLPPFSASSYLAVLS
jgi:hypothetical protein